MVSRLEDSELEDSGVSPEPPLSLHVLAGAGGLEPREQLEGFTASP